MTFTGRIKAIQLEYSEARRTLTNALRKAPQHTAVGFKQTVRITHTHTLDDTDRHSIFSLKFYVIVKFVSSQAGILLQ